MIILPNDLTSQEIRVLQEFRRTNNETMTVDQIKAIKHPAGGGETPAALLVTKGFLTADASGFTLTEQGKTFISADPVPMFEGAAADSGGDEADIESA